MIKTLIKAALIATVSVLAATHAGAASQDYLLKLDGVKGEAAKARQHSPLQVTPPVGNARSGVNVAAGDVEGDGRNAPEKGHARVRGGLKPADAVQAPQEQKMGLLLPAIQKAKPKGRVRGGLKPAEEVQAPQKPQQGLLLPAVQQVRGSR